MNFLKRALLSTVRKKGKSIILLVVIFILGNLMAGSIAVRQATINVEKTMKSQLGAEAMVQFDWDHKMFQKEEPQFPVLKDETIEKIGKLPNVKYYEYNIMSTLNSTEYQAYCGPDCTIESSSEGNYFDFYGVQIPDLADIKEKKISLIDGRVFKQDEVDEGKKVVMVSTVFSEMNNIHVGDTVTFNAVVMDWQNVDEATGMPKIVSSESHNFEVVGIFDASLSIKEGDKNSDKNTMIDYSLTQRVYVPNKVISVINKKMVEKDAEVNDYGDPEMNLQAMRVPKFYLKDASMLDDFKDEALKLLPEGYQIIVSSDSYDSVAGPISFISWMSTGILYISIGATIMILGLVVILFLRDRRHEFGIYLSIGVRKWKIVTQVVLEVLVVGFIAITLSLFTGKELANGVSQTMIEKQVINGGDSYGGYSYFGQPTMEQDEVLEAYEVKLDGDYILMLYLISLGTLIVASIAPTIYVVRLKPKKVLM